MKNFDFYSHTFQGRRKNNEDACLAVQLNPDNILLAVADGMGGAAAGEIASKLAVEVLQEHIQSNLDGLDKNSDFKKILFEGYRKIQEAINKRITEIPEYQGMGTTLCAVWIYKDQYIWANLGDSRIYFLNDKIVKQITKDHTYVQDFMDKHGAEVPKEIAQQYGNYIMRSMDGGKDVPDIFPLNKPFETIHKNSAFLLCSDGLIPDKLETISTHLHQIFLSQKSLKAAANALVKFAYDKGSTDNITVVLGENGKVKRAAKNIRVPKILLISTIALIIVTTGILALYKTGIMQDKLFPISEHKNENIQKSEIKETEVGIEVNKMNPYNAFSPHKKYNIEFSLKKAEVSSFLAYVQPVKEYVVIFKGKQKEIIKKNAPNNVNIVFDKNLGLTEYQKYIWIVKAITTKGDTITSDIERLVDIKP